VQVAFWDEADKFFLARSGHLRSLGFEISSSVRVSRYNDPTVKIFLLHMTRDKGADIEVRVLQDSGLVRASVIPIPETRSAQVVQ